MSEESDGLYSEKNIQDRYRYHTGKKKSAGNSGNDQFRTSFTGNDEWYTPLVYIEAAREVMGSIDLDPASNEFVNKTMRTTTYYAEGDSRNILKRSKNGKYDIRPSINAKMSLNHTINEGVALGIKSPMVFKTPKRNHSN